MCVMGAHLALCMYCVSVIQCTYIVDTCIIYRMWSLLMIEADKLLSSDSLCVYSGSRLISYLLYKAFYDIMRVILLSG